MKVSTADIKIGSRFRKDLGKTDDLEESIKELGQLVPIAIDLNPSPPPKYMVVDGERRIVASKKLGYSEIEAVKVPENNTTQQR